MNGKPCFHHRKRNPRGFGLLEIILALTISLVVTMILAQISVSVARMAGALDVGTTLQADARRSMDRMTDDIQAGEAILPVYTLRSGATVRTDDRTTLILRVPSYDSGGLILAGRKDTIVYRLIAASSPSEGPHVLKRSIEPDALSARVAENDRIMARCISSAQFTYLARQTMVGNGLNLTFGLDASALGVGANAMESLTINGSPLNITSGTTASILGPGLGLPLGALVFLQPPQNQAVIELVYLVAPWLAPTPLNVEQVKVSLQFRASREGLGPQKTQSLSLTTGAVLRNR